MMIILVLYTYRYCFPEVTGHKPRQCLDHWEWKPWPQWSHSEVCCQCSFSGKETVVTVFQVLKGHSSTEFFSLQRQSFFRSEQFGSKAVPQRRIPGTRLVCAARIQSSWGWCNWHLEHCKIGEARGVSKKSTITWFLCRRNGDKWHTELHNLTTWKQVFALVYAMFAHTTVNQTNSGTWKSHIHWNETSKEAEN